jgi:Major tropism determinant N-terminal domain
MGQRIKQRRDTAANWNTTNPVLADGELGYDKTSKQYKTGDGTTAWTSLPYNRIDAANIDNLPAAGQSAAQVSAAITAAGGQTAAQVSSAITAAGGQTATQVSAAITAAGGQTAAQVDSAIVAKGYQTAAQVAALVIDGGNAAG